MVDIRIHLIVIIQSQLNTMWRSCQPSLRFRGTDRHPRGTKQIAAACALSLTGTADSTRLSAPPLSVQPQKMLIIRCAPALLRSHNEQVIVELPPPTTRHFQPEEIQAQDHATRSRILASMEAPTVHRQARYRHSLASKGIQALLAVDIEAGTGTAARIA